MTISSSNTALYFVYEPNEGEKIWLQMAVFSCWRLNAAKFQ